MTCPIQSSEEKNNQCTQEKTEPVASMNPSNIREFAASFQKSRILLSGFELDLFTHIEETGTASNDLSAKLGLDPHACERLLNALVSVGFLVKRDNLFFHTEESFHFLSRKGPEYLGGLMHTNHLWKSWSNLTEVVRTGKAAHPEVINDRGDEWLLSFITAMHDRAVKQAPGQLAGIDLSGVRTILDVGGGSGAFSIQFLRMKPDVHPTVFDLPNVIPITAKFLEKEGFGGIIGTWTGDYTTDELPGGFDLVFLSAIIHSNSLKVNRELIKKCYRSLNKNGRIIIQDWIMNNDRTQPVAGAVFAINMLVGTDAGDCFTEGEVREMLISAGFSVIEMKELGAGLGQVIAARI